MITCNAKLLNGRNSGRQIFEIFEGAIKLKFCVPKFLGEN
jgi:hypothetical protein